MLKRERISSLPFIGALFLISVLLRIRSIHIEVVGDESLYYYLSKTLGFASAPMKSLIPLWTHVSVRPFMYLFYFPWAQLGFIPFRFVNILVGSAVPCLVFALSRRMRVNPYVATCFALLLSLHPKFILFSAIGFPDMLATALLLVGLLAYFSNSTRWATLFLGLSVLTKEAFAMFLIPLLADGVLCLWRARQRLVLAPAIGLALVAITNGFEVYVLHGAPQGWSSNRISDEFYMELLWSYWFLPFALLLLLSREYRVFAVSLGAPVFFYVWGHVLKKGVEDWYIIGPFAVAVFVSAVAVQRAIDTLHTSNNSSREGAPDVPRWKRIPMSLCGGAALIALILAPENTSWRKINLDKSITQLSEPWPRADAGTVAQAAAALETLNPDNLLVMDAFWGYSYYPFGLLALHNVDSMCTEENDNCRPNEVRLREALLRHTEVIWANKNLKWANALRPLLRGCQAFRNSEFTIYKLNATCRKQLETR